MIYLHNVRVVRRCHQHVDVEEAVTEILEVRVTVRVSQIPEIHIDKS